ncbi:MAG: hypothetical protein HC880_06020, partial [Bacteroidia bacterium]|nr:hypothetical protein [Bacteroidia bacterium]
RQAADLASSSAGTEVQADALSLLGHLEGFFQEDAEKAYEYHHQAYQIYRMLYQNGQLDKWKMYDFLNLDALPTYQKLVEMDSKRRRQRKIMKKYQALSVQFAETLTELASDAQIRLQNSELDRRLTNAELSNKEQELSEKSTEIQKKNSELRQKSAELQHKNLNETPLAAGKTSAKRQPQRKRTGSPGSVR